MTILSLAIIIGEYGDDRVNCDNLSELINRNEIPAIAIKISIKISIKILEILLFFEFFYFLEITYNSPCEYTF